MGKAEKEMTNDTVNVKFWTNEELLYYLWPCILLLSKFCAKFLTNSMRSTSNKLYTYEAIKMLFLCRLSFVFPRWDWTSWVCHFANHFSSAVTVSRFNLSGNWREKVLQIWSTFRAIFMCVRIGRLAFRMNLFGSSSNSLKKTNQSSSAMNWNRFNQTPATDHRLQLNHFIR